MCIYRVLQEAQQVHVKLGISPNRVSLIVKDDGRCFMVPECIGEFTVDDHFGLLGIYEHVELLDGKLDIQSSLGRGCQITVGVPLRYKETPIIALI